MKCVCKVIGSIVLVVLSFSNLFASDGVVPGRHIVVFQDWVGDAGSRANQLANLHGLGLGHVYKHAIKGFVATIPSQRLNDVKNDIDVKYLSPDKLVSAFEPGNRGKAPGKPPPSPQPVQVLPTGINRVNAELSSIALINGIDQRVNVDVAVIDTGIDKSHPDLNVVGGVSRGWS